MCASTACHMIVVEEGGVQMTICMIAWYWAGCHNRGYRGITLLSLITTARVIACLLSRRFILTHLIYTHIHITMPALDLHYIWALGHAITVACSCTSIPVLLFTSLKRDSDEELMSSIRHFPNGLIPFNPSNDLQTPIYWYASIIRYCLLQSIRNPKGGCCVY
jgi:hypothetical protein